MYFRNLIIYKVLERVFTKWVLINQRNIAGAPGRPNLEGLTEHEFTGEGFEPVQPEKQAMADEINLRNYLKSRDEVIRGRGGDPDVVNAAVLKEQKFYKENELPLPDQDLLPPPPEGEDE